MLIVTEAVSKDSSVFGTSHVVNVMDLENLGSDMIGDGINTEGTVSISTSTSTSTSNRKALNPFSNLQ